MEFYISHCKKNSNQEIHNVETEEMTCQPQSPESIPCEFGIRPFRLLVPHLLINVYIHIHLFVIKL